LPKARKVLADKLLLFVMSEGGIFNEEQSEQLMNILSENDFLEENLEVEVIREQINTLLCLQ
jgi:hypothetical protein